MDNITEIRVKSSETRILVEVIQQNKLFIEFVEEKYEENQIRMRLLRDILLGMKNRKKDELMWQIYLYGSMLRDQDLIARQLFLWLLKMADQRE